MLPLGGVTSRSISGLLSQPRLPILSAASSYNLHLPFLAATLFRPRVPVQAATSTSRVRVFSLSIPTSHDSTSSYNNSHHRQSLSRSHDHASVVHACMQHSKSSAMPLKDIPRPTLLWLYSFSQLEPKNGSTPSFHRRYSHLHTSSMPPNPPHWIKIWTIQAS